MYDIQLEINGVTLRMNHATGYDISTISGLTGTSARLDTVQSNIGIGEMYTSGTVGGISLSVKGYILDGRTAKKQALIDTVVPLGQGTLKLYKKKVSSVTKEASKLEPYRMIDVVVKETPTITQEKHSKFSFVLYAPKPIWKAAEPKEISLDATGGNISPQEITVDGQVPADYEMRVLVTPFQGNKLIGMTLYWDSMLGKSIYINFQKYDINGVGPGSVVELKRINGKLQLTVDGKNATKCIWSQSTLDSFEVGNHKIILSPSAHAGVLLKYYPSYVGVIYDGV